MNLLGTIEGHRRNRREARPMCNGRWKILLLSAGLAWGCSAPAPQQPVASTSSPTPVQTPTVRPFPQKLIFDSVKKWTSRFPGTSSVICGPLEEPLMVAHQPDRRFEAASLVKLPILIELARRVDAGQCKLEQRLVFEERFRVGGSGVLQEKPAGGQYSLDELAHWMVCESDNVATDMLLDFLELSRVDQAMRELGLKNTTVERTIFDFGAIEQGRDNRISGGDAAWMLSHVARRELPGSDWMLSILRQTRRRDLICAKLPPQLVVAHKTGELEGFLHDAAFIEEPPLILVILTEGAEKKTAQDWIQGLSLDLYNLVR